MSIKWNTALVNFVAAKGSLRQASANARGLLFSGSQPSDSDQAASGATLLATLTRGGGAFAGETLAEWKSTLTGSAGTLDGLVLGALVRSSTAQTGAATTITLDASASATDDEYNGMYLLITGGPGIGQYRRVSDYDGTTKIATVPAWGTNPDATSTFQLVAGIDLMGQSVAFSSDLTTTAANAATEVVEAITYPDLDAYNSGADLYIKAPRATGSLFNGLRLFGIGSGGLTITVANGGQPQVWGVDGANGVNWSGVPSSGVLSKEATAMQGNGVAVGTAGFFRMVFDPADDGLSASTTYPRMDGLVGTSGADMNISTTQIAIGTPVVLSSFPLSVLKSK